MASTRRQGDEALESRELQALEATLPRRSSMREVWVGVLAIVGVLGTLIALFTLTDASMFRGRYVVTSVVSDAGGLRRGDPVQMRGVNIGRVQDFSIGAQGVAIRLEIDGEYGIPEGSRMVLQSSGLLGGRVADIVPGGAPGDVAGGDTIPGYSPTGFSEATEDLTQGAQTALERINTLLSEPTVDAVGQSAQELRSSLGGLSAMIDQQRGQIAALVSSLQASASQLQDATAQGQLTQVTNNLQQMSERLDATSRSVQQASSSLETVLGRMERGEGTLGRLSKDEALYDNLNAAAVSLHTLLDDVRANPKKYLNVKVF